MSSAQDDSKSLNQRKYDSGTVIQVVDSESSPPMTFRLYKRRFLGLTGMVILSLVTAMSWPWFGPISNNTARDFSITLDQVSWLGNVVALVYLPTAFLVPVIVSKFGFRRSCDFGVAMLLISGWVRYAGTASTLSASGRYTLLLLGQIFAAIAQPIFQVLGPMYSELWFDLKGRTTVTMIIAISNPVGGAIGQLLSPLVGTPAQSVLILAIISSAAIPFVFLISAAPPTPPTFAASQPSPTLRSLLRAWTDKEPDHLPTHMSRRERFDFTIVVLVFAILAGMSNAFAVLSNQYLEPVGYSADLSGLMGATLLLAGVIAAFVSAPLFDRVLTHHLAITAKLLVPIIAIGWLSLIWAVRPNVTGALFALFAVIGAASIVMLPVALELACELTRNANSSSAVLWFSCNLVGFIIILVNGALRAPDTAEPPLNMRRALIFNGVCCVAICSTIFLLRGRQRRREMDQIKLDEAQAYAMPRNDTE